MDRSLVFEAIYFPVDEAVSEGANFSLGTKTFLEASTSLGEFPPQETCAACNVVHNLRYLSHNQKIGGVQLSQQRPGSTRAPYVRSHIGDG